MKVDVLIVGAGIAGFSAAKELHNRAPATSVLLVESEARLPYKRTKLSKFLAQGFEYDAFALEEASWYNGRILLKTGCTVMDVDPAERKATLSDKTTVEWTSLLLATGARPNLPQVAGVGEWLVFHSQEDTEKLRARWADETEVAILGNGVLGVEIAEQATLAGKRAILWSQTPLPLTRELTPAASRMLARTLAAHGIAQEHPSAFDHPWAVAAVGSEPDLRLARASGIAVSRGVLVDASFRTNLAGIWSAGDGAELPGGVLSHLWHESEAQGEAAARSILGLPLNFSFRPWRLKTELFDTYWYSMNKPKDTAPDFERIEGGFYQAFWYNEDRLASVVMANDKKNNRLYEQAVVEGWSKKQVMQAFGR